MPAAIVGTTADCRGLALAQGFDRLMPGQRRPLAGVRLGGDGQGRYSAHLRQIGPVPQVKAPGEPQKS